MGAYFSGIEIGLTALRSFKTAEDVIGNNIANVSTPGYVRREAVLQAAGSSEDLAGGGVNVTGIRRLCDGFARAQARAASGAARKEEFLRDTMVEAEQYLNPLTGGSLYDQLGTFWTSLQALSNSPADGGLREAALAGAKNVAQAVNELSGNYTAMKVQLGQAASAAVTDLNSQLQNVAALNRQIQSAEASGNEAATLRDQRDQLVGSIAGNMNVDVCEQADGLYISCGGQVLVFGSSAAEVGAGLEGAAGGELTFRLASGQKLEPVSGRFSGLQESVAQISALGAEVRRLSDSFASSAPGSLNAIHSAGRTLSGAPSGEPLFNLDPYGRLQVNPAIAGDASLLAAAQTSGQGDGSNASALAAALKAPQIGSLSPSEFLSAAASRVGTRTANLTSAANRAGLVESAALDTVDSTSGVSLDEETSRLLELQNSYASAAKFISAANSMMDDLLALIR